MASNPSQNLCWPPGYDIQNRDSTIAAALIQEFKSIPVSIISDCLGRSVGARGLMAYHRDETAVLCGPALTVRVRPGDNLMIHKALMMAEPGDVLVIDGAGDLTQALVGGLIRTTCVQKQIAGLVVDGAIRDVLEWREDGLPIYARGHTHRGPSKDGPGAINIAVSCASMQIQSGDLVIGDADGVVSVARADLHEVLNMAKELLKKEDVIRKQNFAGTSDPERFNSILRQKGVPC